MKLTNKQRIELAAEKGLSEGALKELYDYLSDVDILRFDDSGNPYWESNGEPLETDVELKFED